MKARILCFTLMLVASIPIALAGEIYGKVFRDNAPLAEGAAEVALKCGETSYPAVKTDKSGSYRLVAQRPGKCTLTVTQAGQTASLDVASYDEAVQVDLVLETKDAKLAVRRK
jgi:hypothetical protein